MVDGCYRNVYSQKCVGPSIDLLIDAVLLFLLLVVIRNVVLFAPSGQPEIVVRTDGSVQTGGNAEQEHLLREQNAIHSSLISASGVLG